MKHAYGAIILASLIITGCVKQRNIEFTGTAPGVSDGVFIVKTTGDSAIYGENIKNGKFSVTEKPLKYPGYYLMDITDLHNTDNHEPFEVYLEPGKYIVETEAGHLFKYPKITSPSKIQQQLSAYYTLADQLSLDINQQAKKLNEEIRKKGNSLSGVAYSQLLNKLSAAESKNAETNTLAFKQFVKQYPESEISAHLMAKLNYEDDPVSYYAIYKTLSLAAKSTDEGKEIGDKLRRLVKLVPGMRAPYIYGKMPDGKQFDENTVNKKVIVVEFWRASNEVSRRNHTQVLNMLSDKANLGIVSVSFDTKSYWWTTAISEDHMTWPQVSDLKGDDSPNAANWAITKIPTYYLLDGRWNIIERDISADQLSFAINNYLETHH
jgi:hypothetical protein